MPLPMWAKLETIDINNGTAGEPAIIYSTYNFLDDMDLSDSGFILTNGSDLASFGDIGHLQGGMAKGSLIFISNSGEVIGRFKDERLIHPSAVKIVDHKSEVFAKGDVIVTDKGVNGEFAAPFSHRMPRVGVGSHEASCASGFVDEEKDRTAVASLTSDPQRSLTEGSLRNWWQDRERSN